MIDILFSFYMGKLSIEIIRFTSTYFRYMVKGRNNLKFF